MVNNCKRYSSSFSDVLGMCIASVASLQIMVDHGRKHQKNREIFSLCLHPHRLNRGLALNVCVGQCIKLFQCFTSFITA